MKRMFMRPGPKPINDIVHHVEFEFDEDVDGNPFGVARRGIRANGSVTNNCPWSFKDALSHVGAGTWVEVVQNEQTGEWLAPGPVELEVIAKKRTTSTDAPCTTMGMVW